MGLPTVETFDSVSAVDAIMANLRTPKTRFLAFTLAFAMPELLAIEATYRIWYVLAYADIVQTNVDRRRQRC